MRERNPVWRKSILRPLCGAGFGAIVIALLAASPGHAQEESPITRLLRDAVNRVPQVPPAPDTVAPDRATQDRAASDSVMPDSAAPDSAARDTAAPAQGADSDSPDETPDNAPAAAAAAPDDGIVDWSALNSDPPHYDADAPVKALRSPGSPSAPPVLDVSRTNNPDGSAAMVLKQPLTTPWQTKVGADVSLAAPPATTYQPDRPLPGSVTHDSGTGGAWLSTDAPGIGTIGARVDAQPDQRKLGGTIARAVPLGQDLSVTLHGAYAVTDTSAATAITSAVPLAAAPATAVAPPRVVDSEDGVTLTIVPTGTSLGAGVTASSTDSLSHHKLVAEQSLYGPLHVTGTVTDMGQADSSKSITAGIKFQW